MDHFKPEKDQSAASNPLNEERGEQTMPDILSFDDGPELTEELLAKSRPAPEVLNEIFPADVADQILRRPGRPKSSDRKELISIRLSKDVLDFYRAQGKGWQTKIDETLQGMIRQQQ